MNGGKRAEMQEVYSSFLKRLDQYRDLSSAYLARGVDMTRNPDDKENARSDWQDHHYISIGYDAIFAPEHSVPSRFFRRSTWTI